MILFKWLVLFVLAFSIFWVVISMLVQEIKKGGDNNDSSPD